MKKPLISRRPIILLSASVLLATLFLITLVLLPHGISYGIKQWILDNGGERVSIENVDFNPFTGNFAIYNLNVGKNNITPLNITEIKLHLNWLSLWSNQVLIEGVSIRGVNLLIDQSEKAYSQIGGIMLAPEPKTKTADESDSPWGLAIQFLNMRDVSIDYKIQALSSRLQIKRFEMKSLASAHPNQETIVKLDGQLDNAEIKLQGKLKPFSAEPGFTGKVEMKGVTLNKYASLLPPSISQVKGSSNIDTEFGIHLMPGGQIKVTQKGAISLNSIRLAVDASQLKSNKITWKGQTDYISSRHDGVSIKLNGDISLHDTQVASETTQITAKAFHWKGKTNYKDSSDNTINLKLSGDLGLIKSKLFLPGEALEIEQGKLTWSGNSDISIPANSAGTLIANGKTSSEQFRLFASQRDADVQYEKLTWDGGIDLNLESGLNNLMANGHVAVQSFQATAPNANYVLMAFEHLDVDKFKVKLPQDTSSERLEFAGLMLGKQQPTEDVAQEPEALSLVHYGKLTLDKLQYSEDDGLAIHIIRQTDATQMVRHRSDGKWNAVRLIDIMESAAKGKAQDVTPAAQEKSLRIVVDKIIVDGNSKIIFEDLQPNPRFRQELKVENARLEKLDTNIPDQASPLELNGVFVPHAKVTLSGVVSPFAERLTLDIKGNVNGLPLPPLSSYSKKLLGYTLDSGELDADITLKANNGQLAGENKLNLHQLEVTPLPPDNKKDVEAKLDVPLETGLAMLRDKNNNIQLSMPLTGDVDNFELDPSDAINQVVGKAMKTAAKSYLSAALFPYGTLLTVAQLAGEQVMKVNLDPVFYTPGSTRLGTKDKEYLGKVATILSERPEIHVKLCGIATETDRAHLIEKNKENTDEKKQEQQNSTIDEQLKLLAQNRAEIIEKYLVEEHDTKANRLISCQPSIEKEDAQAKPRTELSL